MCTTILVGADRSALGTPLLAKNRDLECGDVLGEGMLVEGKIDYRFKGFSFRDIPDQLTQGINEKGLCLAYVFIMINKKGWKDDWQPIPGATAPQRKTGALGREILGGCACVEEAVGYVMAQAAKGRCVGGTILFADPGGGVVVEAVDDEFAIRRLDDGLAVQTNHFLRLHDLGPDAERYPSSYARRARALDLLAAHPVIDPETLAGVLSDHHAGPSEHSICRHGDLGKPLDHFTAAAVIMIPKNAGGVPELRLSMGNPCRHRFVSHLFG